MSERTVRLPGTSRSRTWTGQEALLRAARDCRGDPTPVLTALRGCTPPPLPGPGETLGLWELLASLGAADLTAARAVEPHLDALAILAQAGTTAPEGTAWGVFAAESRETRLTARKEGRWLLDGVKPWCSLAADLDFAIVTAHAPGGRRAFAVDLGRAGVTVTRGGWPSLGLSGVPSGPVSFRSVAADPVGATGWYLERPGFAVGGMGVAACWFGGAVGLFRALRAAAASRAPDQLALAWLGEADRLLAGAAAHLAHAARLADDGEAGWSDAQRLRGHISQVCARLLAIGAESLGPGPLAFDAEHARRVADLSLYIRQHHAARDDAALGSLLLEQEDPSW